MRIVRGLLLGLVVSVVDVLLGAPKEDSGTTWLEKAYALDSGAEDKPDIVAAAELYQRAANEGDAYAHFRLGGMFERGTGVVQDFVLARNHYQAAVDLGLDAARVRLGICYLEGWGGPLDKEAFVEQIRMAADAGYVPAQMMYSTLFFTGFVVPRDRVAAVSWMEKAAMQNDESAQYEMGNLVGLMNQTERERDLDIARTWYGLSAEKEHLASMRAMAFTYLEGERGSEDWSMVGRWLAFADEMGDAEAPYILAILALVRPESAAEDLAEAEPRLKRAAERGNRQAVELLEKAAAGETLVGAVWYMMTTVKEDRYIESYRRDHETNDDAAEVRPMPYRMVTPHFPEALRMLGEQGQVIVTFVVDTAGRVCDAKALEASHPAFVQPALEAVNQWRFYPGRRQGRSVETQMQVPVLFNLLDGATVGVDEFLDYLSTRAETLGPEVGADAKELRFAEIVGPTRDIPIPAGREFPDDAWSVLVLVADVEGRPIRGHVILASSDEVGTVSLQFALGERYQPRKQGDEFVQGSVVLLVGETPQVYWSDIRGAGP